MFSCVSHPGVFSSEEVFSTRTVEARALLLENYPLAVCVLRSNSNPAIRGVKSCRGCGSGDQHLVVTQDKDPCAIMCALKHQSSHTIIIHKRLTRSACTKASRQVLQLKEHLRSYLYLLLN